MLIAIASDLHDNLANWKIFNDYSIKQDIKILLFCGDIDSEESLKAINKSHFEKIYLIAGNAETYDTGKINKFSKINFLGNQGQIIIDRLHIGLTHQLEDRRFFKRKNNQLDYIFYGHTHKPWLEKEDNLIIANPGTLGGVFYPASFSVLNTNTKNLKLKLIQELL